jgi:hypothetical protein
MLNKEVRNIVEQRVRLEARIRELGGKIPAPWPWADQDPVIRNLQLLEFAEDLEAGRKLPPDFTAMNKLLAR